MKQFRLSADQIRPIAAGHGACFATDMITVHGEPVRYMYREPPDHATDSGWRFFSGRESDEYANDPRNIEIYDVNTIANYDQDIISFLDAPVGAAFERSDRDEQFVLIE